MQKTRVGVVGVGHLGQHHARIYASLPQCELVGVVDVDPRVAQKFARQYNCEGYTDYRQLFGKVDALSIVVPTVYHHAVATECLNAGIHLLVEKPITSTVEQAQELISIASARSLVLQVGHIERFNTAVMRLKQLVNRPLFIEGHRLGPYDPRIKDVGVVLDLMIHDLDIVLQLVNSPLKSVEGAGVGVYGQNEDIANARLHFENGCIANLTASRITPSRKRKIRIFQPDAYLSIDYIEQEVEIFQRIPVEDPEPGMPKISIVRRKEKIEKKEPLRLELVHFLDCVVKGGEPMVRGEHARDALQLAVEISEQIRSRTADLGLLQS